MLNLLWHIEWASKCGRVECIQGMSVGNGYWMGLANSKGDKYGHTAHGVAQIALKDEHTQRQKADAMATVNEHARYRRHILGGILPIGHYEQPKHTQQQMDTMGHSCHCGPWPL